MRVSAHPTGIFEGGEQVERVAVLRQPDLQATGRGLQVDALRPPILVVAVERQGLTRLLHVKSRTGGWKVGGVGRKSTRQGLGRGQLRLSLAFAQQAFELAHQLPAGERQDERGQGQ